MKLLHVVPTYWPAVRYGGTIWSVHGLCAALVRRGHEIHVWTTNVDGRKNSLVRTEAEIPVDGVKVKYFCSTFMRRLYWSPGMAKALKNAANFDLMHLHSVFLWPTWAAARAAQKNKVPYLVSPRGMLVPDLIAKKNKRLKMFWINRIEKKSLERATAVHFTSGIEAEEAAKFGIRYRKIFVVPNGYGSVFDESAAPKNSISEAEAVRAGAAGPYLLFLGRIHWKKGLDRLIKAMAHVSEVRLVIAGNDDENYRPALQSLAWEAKVNDRILFMGPAYGAAKATLIKNAKLFVLPSYSENFGNSVLEAMAVGRPVAVTPEVGLSEAITAAGAGLVTEGDAETLGKNMKQLLSDPAKLERMGEAGRALVREKYSWDGIAMAMERIYREIANP